MITTASGPKDVAGSTTPTSIVEFPAVWSAGSLAAVAAAVCATMLFGSWLASAAVRAQPLRSLVEEA